MEAKNISAKEAVCQYIGCAWEDVEADHRYHAGMTSIPVYTSGEEYVCATANGKSVPKRDVEYVTNGEGGKFVEATGSVAEYCKSRGRTVWVFKAI